MTVQAKKPYFNPVTKQRKSSKYYDQGGRLIHFSPIFNFYTPWKHKKYPFFVFRGYRSGTLVENVLHYAAIFDILTKLLQGMYL